MDRLEKHAFKVAHTFCKEHSIGTAASKHSLHNDWTLKELWWQKDENQTTLLKTTAVDQKTDKVYVSIVTELDAEGVLKFLGEHWDGMSPLCDYEELPFTLEAMPVSIEAFQEQLPDLRKGPARAKK